MKNMRNRKKLPIGIDSFEKIIRHNFLHVDKTEMITELLHNWGEVNLFTRPRRFWKISEYEYAAVISGNRM